MISIDLLPHINDWVDQNLLINDSFQTQYFYYHFM